MAETPGEKKTITAALEKKVQEALAGLAGALREADLDFRIDTSSFTGAWKNAFDDLNSGLDSLASPIIEVCDKLGKFANSEVPEKATGDLKGCAAAIADNLNNLIDVVDMRQEDIKLLQDAARLGDLSVRADVSKYTGYNSGMITAMNEILDILVGPIRIASDNIKMLAEGQTPERITAEYCGEFNLIKESVNSVVDSLSNLVDETGVLMVGVKEGRLETRADAGRVGGVYRKILRGFNETIEVIAAPVEDTSRRLASIADGEIPEKMGGVYAGTFEVLARSVNSLIDSVNGMTVEINKLCDEQGAGEIDYAIATDGFQGIFKEICDRVNETVREIVRKVLKILDVTSAYAEGDFSPILEPLPGKQVVANQKLDLLRDNLLSVIADLNMLANAAMEYEFDLRADPGKHAGEYSRIVEVFNKTLDSIITPLNAMVEDAAMLSVAAVEGRLATRADASKHRGDFQKIIQGVNDTLDAVINPLNVAAGYVDRISKGDIPEKITDDYNGDFNEIKNNLNLAIDAVNALVVDANMLSVAAVEGRLATRADASKHQGDFQKIVQGVNDTLDAVINPLKEAASVLEEVASKRDLGVNVTGDYKGDHQNLKNSINKTLESLNGAMQQVADATAQVTAAGGQISASAQSLSQGSAEQASSLEEITASVEEITGMSKQNAENADQARQLAQEARGSTEKADASMVKMGEAINEIKVSSDETSKIIKTIDEIAFQTNLLALNAAVEAARAGEAGKGFAVVAEEVRNLAMRSAEAAKNTSDLIEGSVKNTDNGVKIADEVATALKEIIESFEKVNNLVAEIAAASREQVQGIQEVNGAMGEMDKVTQSNAAIAEESASASEELASQATQLSDMVKTFKLAITDGRSEYAGSSGLSSKDMNTLRALVQQESRKSTAVGPTSSAPKTVSAPRTSVNDTPESAIPFDDDFDEF